MRISTRCAPRCHGCSWAPPGARACSRSRCKVGTDTCSFPLYRCRCRKQRSAPRHKNAQRETEYGRSGIVRKALVLIAVAAALVLSASATAAVAPTAPDVVCGTACDGGGGGWSGCTQDTASDSGGIPWIAYYKHFLVVSYCKQNGVIT